MSGICLSAPEFNYLLDRRCSPVFWPNPATNLFNIGLSSTSHRVEGMPECAQVVNLSSRHATTIIYNVMRCDAMLSDTPMLTITQHHKRKISMDGVLS